MSRAARPPLTMFLTLCASAGAVASIVVGWMLAWYGPDPLRWLDAFPYARRTTRPTPWPTGSALWVHHRGSVQGERRVAMSNGIADGRWATANYCWGWPWPCVSATLYTWEVLRFPGPDVAGSDHDGVPLPKWMPTRRRLLPVGIVWSGLALDILPFGAGCAVLLFGVERLKGFRRARCGLCATCGYDLKGAPTSTCPECGA